MKNIKYTLLLLLIFIFSGVLNNSCTKLDEEVYSDLTGELFFADPDNLIYAFGTAYTNLYSLVGHKYGMVGIECGTDLLVVPQRGGDWLDGGEWHRWHRLTFTPNEGYIERWWNNIFFGITTCNRLIYQFELVEGVDTEPAIAELRGLRALYYYWLVDLFGNVPIVDRFDVPADFKPETRARQDVYNFIESELLEVRDKLSKETGLAYYGRINYYAAEMILAKLYMNAEVYTGTPQWQNALEACDSIIESNNYALEGDYFDNFVEDATSSPEHILGLHFDQVEAPQFEIHLFTLHYNLVSKYGFEDNSWNGICAQEGLFNYFDETDLRLGGLLYGFQYDNEGNPIEDPSYEKFPNVPFDPDGAHLNLTPVVNMLQPNCLRQAGARIAKFPFIEGSTRYTSNDFPIFRYADVLLMKAEILLRMGGDLGEALNLVNMVRERAGVEAFNSIDFDMLLEERARELFAEGHRRSDLIRFGKYLDARWEKPEISPDYVTLWPIPQSQINANQNLVQNPGYN
ncbi:MAG: RagB/SusD family nutrient uptake outer membrane protein [Bacteroidales bacterium]|nr:RagB/SusD family nutrient uptake outer membrane protein [Bacteroidales bacterium]MCF8404888.1 RagB/SusD family nutrient uptake outer membrane protein [Bacteroidales bacterium]